jgi:hypothetical protein
MTALLLAIGPAVGRADDGDAVRTMLGVATLPNGLEADIYVGKLPKGMLFVPQPAGLALLGSVAASADGKTTNEVLYFQAPAGSLPDVAGYERLLDTQGWALWSPGGVPQPPFLVAAMSSVSHTFCKAGNPTITVRVSQQYLVVSAMSSPGVCSAFAMGINPARRVSLVPKAPYPLFSPPYGATFVGSANQTFTGQAHVASITLVSTQPAGVLRTALAAQMTRAGWKARADAPADADSQAFTIRDSGGTDWVAALSVVQVGNGMYLFTLSAFKMTEAQAI